MGVSRTFGRHMDDCIGEIEYPLAGSRIIGLDDEGRIFLMHLTYYRIQVYESNGEILCSWAHKPGGSHWVDPDGHIHQVISSCKHIVYDHKGNVVKEFDDPRAENGYYQQEVLKGKAFDKSGNVYELRDSVIVDLNTQLVRISPSGQKTVLNADTFWSFPFQGGLLNEFMWVPAIVVIIFVLRSHKKAKQNKEELKTSSATELTAETTSEPDEP